MCECLERVEENALKSLRENEQYKKPIERVSLKEVGFPLIDGNMTTRTVSTIQVTLEGQKKKP